VASVYAAAAAADDDDEEMDDDDQTWAADVITPHSHVEFSEAAE